MSADPALSIITPVKNGARHLKTFLDSVDRLHVANISFEHIVVDGGSTDGTQAMLAARSNRRVFIEPQYDARAAVVFGLEQARGRYVMLMMADDALAEAAASALEEILPAQDIDLALFPCQLIDDAGAPLGEPLPAPERVWDILSRYPGSNSTIFRKSLADDLRIPAEFPATNDRLMMLHLTERATQITVGRGAAFASMRVHGDSRTNSPERDVLGLKEEMDRLARFLLSKNVDQALTSILSLWVWRAALSLVSERRKTGRPAAPGWRWPLADSLPRAALGLLHLLVGRDRFIGEKRRD